MEGASNGPGDLFAYRWALEATTDCVVILDRDLRIVYVNRRAAALNGRPPEAFVGRLHGDVWPETVGTEVERRYRDAMANGVPTEFDHHYAAGAGPEAWHEIHAAPIPDGLAVFYRDLTHARRREAAARAESERLERSIHDAGIGVWRRDLRSGEVRWSPQMRAHFGLLPDEPVEPDTFDAHVHPEDRDRALAAYRQAIDERTPYDAVYRTVDHDGRVRTIHARGGAVYGPDGAAIQFDGFTLDVTERQETEFQLQTARARLDAVLASADVATWVLDLGNDRLIGDANLPGMFGLDPAEGPVYPADVVRACIVPEDRARIARSLADAVARREPWDDEYRIARDGVLRWLSVRAALETDAQGRVVRVPGVVVDVTALKKAQERLRQAERRQRFRVELMDALRGLGDAREIVAVACRMVGEFLGVSRTTYSLVDLEARTINTSTPYANGVAPLEGVFLYDDFGRALLREIEKGRPFAISDVAIDPVTRDRFESGYVRIDTRAFVVVPLFRDGRLMATFTVHAREIREWTPQETELLENVAQRTWDALERARTEEELRALNAELDARVRERTSELQRANEELQAFTSAISHDLRGPLRNIHGMSKLLLQDAASRLNDDDRRLLERQAHNAMRVSTMVDALLNLARLGREPLNKQPFDLTGAAINVRDDFLARDVHAACQIEIEPGLRAVGDRRLVKFVLLNLMENACKFSPRGGTVRVGERDGAFFVADEGVGFDMAYAAKLFQPFERLVTEKQFPGTGIGLANVQRIVVRHEGRVWAESEPGKGSTFWFTLG